MDSDSSPHPIDEYDDIGRENRIRNLAVKLLLANLVLAGLAAFGALAHPFLGGIIALSAVYVSARLVLDEVYAVARLTYDAAQAEGDA